MKWILRRVGVAGLSSFQSHYVIMAVLGAVVLIVACVACGQVGPSQNIAASENATGSAPSGNSANPESSCPTQGVGGDSLAAPCAATASSNGSGPSISGPVTPSTTVVGPSVFGVSPNSGAESGGTVVSISGTGFTGATQVDFGDISAKDFAVGSDTSITATSPAGTDTVDITVITPAGRSPVSPSDRFTYSSNGTQATPLPSAGVSS